MSINLTDEIDVKTKKGKLCAAKQIFLEGDIQTVEKEIQDINSRHNILNTKHESLSKTVQGISATGGASTATNVTYNNDTSGLTAENAQDAIDELQGSKIDKTSITQVSGDSEELVMSQGAIKTELDKKFDKVSVVQESGDSEDEVMSQKAVSDKLNGLAKDVSLLQIDVLTKSDLNINVNPSILKYAGSYTNEGVWVDSSIFLSSDYIYIGDNDNIFIDIRTDKNTNDSFNILTLFDKDKNFVSGAQYPINNSFKKATISLKGKSVRYCRVSVYKALINDNLSIKITSQNEIEERLTNKECLLGSLLQRTNLIYKEIAGYSVFNGILESEGQQNFKVCVVPVQKGNTYHFYKNNNGKAQEHSANYLITDYLFKDYEGESLSTGTGSSVTIEDDYAYLYVTYNKNLEAMISLSEQTEFIKSENDTYLNVENINIEIGKKLDKEALSQELGTAEDKVVSQKVVNNINDGLVKLIGTSQSETIMELSEEEITLGSISSIDGSNYENDKYARTVFISVEDYDSIHISSSTPNYLTTQRAILVLYDSNKNFVATPIIGINNGSTYDKTISLSEYNHVSYMRIGLNSTHERPTIKLIKFASEGKIDVLQTKVNEHDVSIDVLQTKVNENDVSIDVLQTKVNEHDVSIAALLKDIRLIKHPIAKDISDSSVVISEVYNASTITDGTLYPILKDNIPHGEVSDLWRFSLPVRPNSSVYPKEYGIEVIKPNNIYLTTEFYFEGTEFEIKEPANLSSYLIVDDVIVGILSNTTDQGWVYQKITFSESKKRRIQIRSSFYGIITKGVISKFEKKRMLLAVDGDSITEGTACIYPKHSEYAWSVRVAEILDCDLLNGGVGGSGYVKTGNLNQANMVDRYDSYIGQFNPDILFVMGGLNDGEATQAWKTAVDNYWENVHNTFKGKYVIVASPYWPQKGKNEGISNMTDYLKSVALKYKYPFVDVYNGVTYDAFGQIIAKNSNGGLVNTTNYDVLYKEYVEGTQTDSTHINNITGHEYVGRYIANEIYRICHNDLGINI